MVAVFHLVEMSLEQHVELTKYMGRVGHLPHTILIKKQQHQHTGAVWEIHVQFHYRVSHILFRYLVRRCYCSHIVYDFDEKSVHGFFGGRDNSTYLLPSYSHDLELLQKEALVSGGYFEVGPGEVCKIFAHSFFIFAVVEEQFLYFLHIEIFLVEIY